MNRSVRIRLASAVLLFGTGGASSWAGETKVTPELVGIERSAEVRRETAKALLDARDAPNDALPAHAEKLAGIGSEMLDAAVEFLSEGCTPAAEDRPSVRVGAREREFLLRSISRIDRARAMERLRTAAKPADAPRRRAAVISALGAVGGPEAVDVMLDLVAIKAGSPSKETGRDVAVSLEDALARGLDADPATVERVSRRWNGLPADLRRATLRTAALLGTAPAADLVANVIEGDPENSLHALAEVPRIARAASPEAKERLTRFAAEKITDTWYAGRGEAARALGHLRAEGSVPALFDLLAGENDAEREAALWSLRTITGLGFDAHPAAWRFWYEEESSWVRTDGVHAEERLADRDPAVATEWLRKIGTLHLGRERWAVRAAAALRHPLPIVRAAACRTLRDLGSPEVAGRLADALEDSAQEVRDAALEALRALTGIDLPADSIRWRQRLADDAAVAAGRIR